METNANDAYREARERLDERLNMINRVVRAHVERQSCDRENWALVGDVNHLNDLLDEAIVQFARITVQKGART